MNIGIIGSGMIANVALDTFTKIKDIKCTALYYRSSDKPIAQRIAKKYQINSIYDDIDDFLKDTSFQTVYIGVINSLHYYFSKKSLLSNKNVICEKPFTSNYHEALELKQISEDKKKFLFGAIRLRYLKNYYAIKDNLSLLGNLKMVLCNYSQYSRRYDQYLDGNILPVFDPKFSGGSLYDLNVYNVYLTTSLLGEPKKINYFPNKGFNGIDTSGALIMDYSDFKVICVSAKDSSSPSFVSFQGEKGFIESKSISPQLGNLRIRINNKDISIVEDNNVDPIKNEFEHIFDIISNKKYDISKQYLEETILSMKVLDEARANAGISFSSN